MIRHEAVLRIGDVVLRGVTHYDLTYDLRVGYPALSVTVQTPSSVEEALRRCEENKAVVFEVDGQLLTTLRCNRPTASWSDSGTTLSLSLSGATSVLQHSPMPLGWRPGTRTLYDCVREICGGAGVTTVVDRTAEHIELGRRRMGGFVGATTATTGGAAPMQAVRQTWIDDRELRPRPGEMRLTWVARVTKRNGFRCWEMPGGELFVGTPTSGSSQPAGLYDATARSLAEGAVRSVTVERVLGGAPHAVRVVGRVGRRGQTRVDVTVADELSSDWPDAMLVEIPTLRGYEEARKQAERILADTTLSSRVVTVECVGNGPPSAVAWPDHMYTVHAPTLGVDTERLYCVAVRWSHGLDGTKATSTLINRDAFATSGA